MAGMAPGILLKYLAALLVSFAAVVAAYRLLKKYRHSFLSDYTVFLLLSAVWGFALWTIPGFVEAAKAASGGAAALSRIPLVSKWFGFPFHLVQLYFLALTLAGLLGIAVTKTFKRTYLAVSGIITIVLFGALLNMLGGGGKDLFAVLHAQTTNAYLIFQALLFVWAGLRAPRAADPRRRSAAGWFSWLYLAGFAAYYAVTSWATWKGATGAWLIGAYHWPPLIVLAATLRRARFLATLPAEAAEDILTRIGLTGRERDILSLLLAGRSNRQIAKDLFLSHQTVKNYVSRIYKKAGVASRLELMNSALRPGPAPASRP